MNWASSNIIMYRPKNDIFYYKCENRLATGAMYKSLRDYLYHSGTSVSFVDQDMPSVWVRDYFPIQVDDKFVQFKFCDDYMSNELERYTSINYQSLFDRLFKPLVHVDLYLDGGNVVMNETTVIITDKVFKDNRYVSRDQIISMLTEAFNGRQIIFIGYDKYDITGHADGLVAFLDNDTLLMCDYSEVDKDLHKKNMKALEQFDPVMIPTVCDEDEVPYKGWFSADNNYINFIGTKNCIILPTFGNLELEENIIELIRRHDSLDRPIYTVPISTLSRHGGGLHCITYDYK